VERGLRALAPMAMLASVIEEKIKNAINQTKYRLNRFFRSEEV
jgi:hypothetical protein